MFARPDAPFAALRDGKVPLGRWYPYGGRDPTQIFPIRIAPSSEGDLVEVVREVGAGVVEKPQIMLVSDLVAGVRRALPATILRMEQMSAAVLRMELDPVTQSSIDFELAALKAFAASNVPLPVGPMTFEGAVAMDVVVKPGPDAPAAQDLWRYIDSLTGGCCNGMMRSVDGESFYEGTWRGDELVGLVTGNKMLTVCAVSLRIDPACEPLVSPETRDILKALPSQAQWNERYRAEHAAWLKPRVETLLAALRAHPLDQAATLIVPPDDALSIYHDTQAHQVSIECNYTSDEGGDYKKRVTMTGSFTPEGKLESVAGVDSIRDRHFTLGGVSTPPSTGKTDRPRG